MHALPPDYEIQRQLSVLAAEGPSGLVSETRHYDVARGYVLNRPNIIL